MQEEGIAMAMDAMNAALSREEVLVMMALRDKVVNDEINSIRQALEEGWAEGLEKGVEKGVEKGRAEVARNLLAEGMERATVLRLTGLRNEDLP